MERTVLDREEDREKLAGVGVAVGSVGDGIGRRWGKTGREAASTGPEIEHGRGERCRQMCLQRFWQSCSMYS